MILGYPKGDLPPTLAITWRSSLPERPASSNLNVRDCLWGFECPLKENSSSESLFPLAESSSWMAANRVGEGRLSIVGFGAKLGLDGIAGLDVSEGLLKDGI